MLAAHVAFAASTAYFRRLPSAVDDFQTTFPNVPLGGAATWQAWWNDFGTLGLGAAAATALAVDHFSSASTAAAAASTLLGATFYHLIQAYAFSFLAEAAGVPADVSSSKVMVHGAFTALCFVSVISCHARRLSDLEGKPPAAGAIAVGSTRLGVLARAVLVMNMIVEGPFTVALLAGYGEQLGATQKLTPLLNGPMQTLGYTLATPGTAFVTAACLAAYMAEVSRGTSIDAVPALVGANVLHLVVAYAGWTDGEAGGLTGDHATELLPMHAGLGALGLVAVALHSGGPRKKEGQD